MMRPATRGLIALCVAVFSFQFTNGINRSIQNNFYVETLGLQADQMGLLTTFRELPGFLTAMLSAALMWLTPPQMGSLSLVVMGLGYAGYGMIGDFGGLLGVAVVASLGFHVWIPIASALGLSLANRQNAGQILGRIQAVGYAAALISMGLMMLVVDRLGYQTSFVLSGVIVVVGALAILSFPRNLAERPKQRIVFRKKYSLYYALTFLDGCRGEVFLAFGVYLLVRQYHLGVQTVTGLLLVSSILSMALSQRVGKLIDTIGERKALTISYSGHMITFLGFALIPNATVAIVLYTIYNILLLFSISTNTYLKRTADPADVNPSLAMGMTTMHISAMIVPILGGMLWERYGYQVPFMVGAGFIVISILVSQRIPKKAPSAMIVEPATLG